MIVNHGTNGVGHVGIVGVVYRLAIAHLMTDATIQITRKPDGAEPVTSWPANTSEGSITFDKPGLYEVNVCVRDWAQPIAILAFPADVFATRWLSQSVEAGRRSEHDMLTSLAGLARDGRQSRIAIENMETGRNWVIGLDLYAVGCVHGGSVG